jgi:alkylation response protein AidB-like acyl-CoA dehydrogenase
MSFEMSRRASQNSQRRKGKRTDVTSLAVSMNFDRLPRRRDPQMMSSQGSNTLPLDEKLLGSILSEEHHAFLRKLREFLEAEVVPLVDDADRRGETPREILKQLGELKLLGLRFPKELGGSAHDFVTVCLFMEEFGRVSPGMAEMAAVQTGLATLPIYFAGTAEQRERYLRPALKGEMLGAFALTEPEAGSDARNIATTARRVDDGWELNGSKIFISNGSTADFAIVAARSKDESQTGVSLFIVDRGLPGFTQGPRIETLGLRASDTSHLGFSNVRVADDALLGKEGQGFDVLMRTLNEGRVLVGAEAVGIARAALEHAISYVQTRRQFDRPLSGFQGIRFQVADMATQLAAAKLLVYHAALEKDRGTLSRMEASMAKLFASEASTLITQRALHLHGGYGYMMEHPLQRFLRDAVVNEIVEGTSEIQRETIARSLGLRA